MMSGRLIQAVLAALAGLLVSVGAVAADGPNQLSNGRVSPTSGTTSTAFTFSVDYRSANDFAATSVVAVVAGRSVNLQLVGGTASAGSFRGTSALPAGQWPVSFHADARQGPDATLAGPTMVVTAPAPATPPPTAATTPQPPPPAKPTPAPSASSAGPPSPGATTRTSPSGAAPATTPTSDANVSPSAAPRDGGTTPSASSRTSRSAAPSPSSAVGGGIVAGSDPGRGDNGPAGSMVVLGLLGLTGAGAAALVIARRRRVPEEGPEQAGKPQPLPEAVRLGGRADTQQVEDPILAAMGLGTTSQPDPNAPITRSVHFGPGERPTPPTYRAH